MAPWEELEDMRVLRDAVRAPSQPLPVKQAVLVPPGDRPSAEAGEDGSAAEEVPAAAVQEDDNVFTKLFS